MCEASGQHNLPGLDRVRERAAPGHPWSPPARSDRSGVELFWLCRERDNPRLRGAGRPGPKPQRFLLVARHVEKGHRSCTSRKRNPCNRSVLSLRRMPLPGDIERAGPMHRVPALQWKNGFALPWSRQARTGAAWISWPSRTVICATSQDSARGVLGVSRRA